jgi:hypothetical protein
MTWYVPCAFLGCVRAGGSEAQESRRCPAATTIFTGPRPPLVRGASAAKTSVCHDYWLGAAIEIRRLRANKTAAEKQTWIMGPIQRRERCGGIGWPADPFCCASESLLVFDERCGCSYFSSSCLYRRLSRKWQHMQDPALYDEACSFRTFEWLEVYTLLPLDAGCCYTTKRAHNG